MAGADWDELDGEFGAGEARTDEGVEGGEAGVGVVLSAKELEEEEVEEAETEAEAEADELAALLEDVETFPLLMLLMCCSLKSAETVEKE